MPDDRVIHLEFDTAPDDPRYPTLAQLEVRITPPAEPDLELFRAVLPGSTTAVDLPVGPGGIDLPDGDYTLRLRAISAEGATSGEGSTWLKIGPVPPLPPSLAAMPRVELALKPADGGGD